MPFPYTFPITFDTGYFIEVDWNNDGKFVSDYDNITADVKSIHFSRGKSDELSKAEVGQLSITINNDTGKYTPGYGGVISALLLPKRPIRVYYSASGTDYYLFYGFIEEIIPHPHLTEQDCIITAVDGLDFLSRHDMATALYKNALTGTIHGYILDDAGWSATKRTIDAGQDTVPYWYGHEVKARFAQEEIDSNEQGFSIVDGAGYFRFEDRHHRSTATHQTSQGTFDNTMAQITYSLNPKNVYNIVKVTVTPWTLQVEAELWRLKETPEIPAGDTAVFWGDSQYFVDNWVTPTSSNEILRPNAAGDTTTLIKDIAGGDNYDRVDESTSDEFTTFLQSNANTTAWLKDLYNLPAHSGAGTVINSVVIYVVCRSSDTPDQSNLQILVKTGGVEVAEAGLTTTTSWMTYTSSYALNPNTLAAWTWADIDDLQIGLSLRRPTATMGGSRTYCTQVYTEINCNTNVDLTVNSQPDGLGDDMITDVALTATKFAKTLKLSIKNNATVPAFITLLKARGTWYDDQTKVTRKAEDSTSQTAYQKRTYELDGKYMTDASKAQDFANYAIGKFKDPRAELSMSLINQDAATLTQILSREISDRITVSNTKLGITNGTYFIDFMEHTISMSGLLHTVTYRLADTTNEDFWCWDFSVWGVSTKWGY